MHTNGRMPTDAATLPRRGFLQHLALTGLGLGWASRSASAAAAMGNGPELAFTRSEDALQLNLGPRPVLRYQVKRPSLGGPAVESGCYLHPVCTPAGVAVTEVGPDDHRHHRGIFCGWVEMHGTADADFWGWGERAPIKDRRIVNDKLETSGAGLGDARFRALNRWKVGDQVLVNEELRVGASVRDGATIVNLSSQYTVPAEVTLARSAFGGFAVRLRKDGAAVAWGPEGEVKLPAPKHTDPASNWPASPWYALHLKLPEGKQVTAVVVGRTANPETTWHVAANVGLINPSITAPGPVRLTPDKPLVLRYRVLLFDGPPRLDAIKPLADSWFYGSQS